MKHVSAVIDFYFSKSANAMICEDDALQNIKLDSLLDAAVKTASFVDLAGGMDIKNTSAKKIKVNGFSFYQFDCIVTNTACAYLIDRKFASQVYYLVMRNPFSMLLPIDWFYLLINSHSELTSARPIKYPFDHGSFNEKVAFDSWQDTSK